MSFEGKIVQVSKIKESKLLNPAMIAAKNPDTGITVQNKSAYFVIRDCAILTQKYLPLYIYGELEHPFTLLRGRFIEKDIIDFVARSQKDLHTKQLLYLIFTDIAKREGNAIITQPIVASDTVLDFSEDVEVDDIYGEYEYVHTDTPTTPSDYSLPDQPLNIDLSDNRAIIDKLIQVFEAVRDQ